MKISTRFSSRFALLAFTILLASLTACAPPPRRSANKNATPWLPKDFDPKGTTLLIAEMPLGRQNNKMEDYMKENYPYKYAFTTETAIRRDTGAYADKKVYRYGILSTTNSATFTSGSGRQSSYSGWDFYIYDRSTRRSYPETRKSASFAMMPFKYMMSAIIEKYK